MSDDPHERFVSVLTARNDWCTLLRHAFAHGLYRPAFEAAVAILEARNVSGEQTPLIAWLREFIHNPYGLRSRADFFNLDLTNDERLAVGLVETFPQIVLCEAAVRAPEERQTELFGIGLKTAKRWYEFATSAQDEALKAAVLILAARAELELRSWESAVVSLEEALASYRRLFVAQPDIYFPYVAMSLNNLGNVQRNLNQWEDATSSFEEALAIRRRLSVAHPKRHLPDVALDRSGNYCLKLRDSSVVPFRQESVENYL